MAGQKRTCGQIMGEFGEFMWNSRTREFMGRTGSSWALILLFYLVFYAFLTALFSLTMWVMLQTIDEYNPKYSDRLANPGLMIRPKLDALEIVYNLSKKGDNYEWTKYVNNLNTVLNDYNTSVQEQRGSVCVSGVFNRQDDTGDVRNYPKKACQFLRSTLQDCSGENDTTYGYQSGQPCILIKMNRVIHFFPEIVKDLSNTSITINCTGKNEEQDRLLGDRIYFPSNNGSSLGTIDLMYYPYYGNKAQKNYTQPLVAVKFLNLTRKMDHNVECRVNAVNINNKDERDKFAGRVMFRLRVDN
ncbi:sodium/potassium-transporting ATPase subunit beta-2 [Bombina bombina]|uniref:sodium/potassium-transporting ATPase subunit beta-2 n=1 Tax=Bombina bombina TaxID=8345 RepID=UPI00235AF826|nr:sodium/potassium-transporting ATPase subunit beta-2 [Bombina bombina]